MPTATIKFLYNNGNPQWSVDQDPLKVSQGAHTVVWQLSNDSSQGAAFAETNGVVFNNKSGNTWPGTPPVKNGNVYRSTETNNVTTKTKYSYSVTVTYTSGGQNQNFTWDPDVENEPPGGEEEEEVIPPPPPVQPGTSGD